MISFWDERYAETGFAYGEEPNAFLRAQLSHLVPGRILFPAEGEGRNAVYAAAQGWQTDAFDFSAVGREKALALAQRHGVAVQYDLADMATVELPAETYDAVALIYVHQPDTLRRRLHETVTRVLRPGGTLLLEAFSKAQMPLTSGGPKDAAMLYDAAMLQEDFRSLRLVSLEETTTELTEGPYHAGTAQVIRLIAEKPAFPAAQEAMR